MKLLGGDPRFDELMRRLRDTGIGKSVSASEWMEVEEFLHDIMTPSEDLSSLATDCCQTVHNSTTNAQAVEVIALKIKRFIATLPRDCGEDTKRLLISGFVEAIVHGNFDHRSWLELAAEAFINGKEIPRCPCQK